MQKSIPQSNSLKVHVLNQYSHRLRTLTKFRTCFFSDVPGFPRRPAPGRGNYMKSPQYVLRVRRQL